ncbi:hypothetical protein, variant [Phytophthora nicotianae CJ01A1]|uniref:Ribosomal RNA-processing protein 43 n=6 Tax=Phytophthora nicotianae TaxID=4792 RepID=W2PEV5_PHYN3|nr:hypothetical protein, variant [Phytophthora nicotianae INRA-310]ETI31078.1 hypothetical protein, variant [Phytophthora nicotianae P1569]ETL78106.1 hypothetical protein, variant [Phytophthora nicotianae]ETO59779.1 hypothetical protein, variant [Phytophthora nicotianae P1976]ETP00891.1 hypothetical protein, variant [Phytophthora nicotianae CJ01A1]ETP29036.1 hypothetical protein, variant [Phytophthora nicotianae P10297]
MANTNGTVVALSFSADMYKKLFPAEYMRKCLANKVRPDSRTIEATRAVQLQTDVVQTAASSSLIKLGKTSVLTAIKLAVGTPAVNTPDQGEIAIQVHLSPLCSNRFTVGRPSEEAQSIGSQLTRIIVGSRVVEMESLSIVKGQSAWKLMVDVYCVDHDGNVLDAALTSIIAALKTLKLPATSVNEADNVVSIAPGELPAIAMHCAISTAYLANFCMLALCRRRRDATASGARRVRDLIRRGGRRGAC